MRKLKPTEVKHSTCLHCGVDFSYKGRSGPASIHCSKACQRGAHNASRAARLRANGRCAIDGCDGWRRSPKSEWCERCYGRNYRHGSPTAVFVRQPNGKCHHCGVAVASARRRAIFCDRLCERRARMGAPGRLLECIVCKATLGEEFNLGATYCSMKCKRTVSRAYTYGLSVPEYLAMVRESTHCALCGTTGVALVVDHCHATHRVRGMLCSPCNVGLGMFAESEAKLLAAIEYLRRHTTVAQAAAPALSTPALP